MRNLRRLTNAANRMQAWEDWRKLVMQAVAVGVFKSKIEMLAPAQNAGWRQIDGKIGLLRREIELIRKSARLLPGEVLDLLD